MFSTANFPSATAGHLTEARALYALLTGRVSSIPGLAQVDSATGKYVYNGDLDRRFRQNSFSAFVQDSWRLTSTLTVNGGVRWDLQLPFKPADNSWSVATIEGVCGISGVGNGVGGRGCNFFNPGSSSGQLVPTFDRLEPGQSAYKANLTDFAPNVGVAWRPSVDHGWLRGLFGDPDQATLRAGYALSYDIGTRSALFATIWNNPGRTIDASKNNTFGYPLVPAGETHPVLLSERGRAWVLHPFPKCPSIQPSIPGKRISATFRKNLRTPRVHWYSVGFQRSLGRDMAVEIRYVGNKNVNIWRGEDWNEFTIFENGFLDEFRAAQRNIAINSAAGLRTFAFTGLPGTAPLPIHLAYLTGRTDANNPAAYDASTAFADEEFIVRLSPRNPVPCTRPSPPSMPPNSGRTRLPLVCRSISSS